jgi:hypothetical protein
MVLEEFEIALQLQKIIWERAIYAMLQEKKNYNWKTNSTEFKKYHTYYKKVALTAYYKTLTHS